MAEKRLHGVEGRLIDDRVMPSFVRLVLVTDQAKVGLVLQQVTQRAATEGHPRFYAPVSRQARLRANAVIPELLLQVVEGPAVDQALEDRAHDGRLSLVDAEPTIP